MTNNQDRNNQGKFTEGSEATRKAGQKGGQANKSRDTDQSGAVKKDRAE